MTGIKEALCLTCKNQIPEIGGCKHGAVNAKIGKIDGKLFPGVIKCPNYRSNIIKHTFDEKWLNA